MRQQTLGETDGVSDVVGRAVGRQQEGRDGGEARVVPGRRPELEEVEEREGGDEEGHAPERSVVVGHVQQDDGGGAKGLAQEPRPQRDAGPRLASSGEAVRVQRRW